MKIDAIASIPMQLEPTQKINSFSQWFSEQITDVNKQLNEADSSLQQLAKGNGQNLHHVMLNLEQAKLSFQLIEQVRNRALTAYQEIMKEQI